MEDEDRFVRVVVDEKSVEFLEGVSVGDAKPQIRQQFNFEESTGVIQQLCHSNSPHGKWITLIDSQLLTSANVYKFVNGVSKRIGGKLRSNSFCFLLVL
jgi:hypothetical protein